MRMNRTYLALAVLAGFLAGVALTKMAQAWRHPPVESVIKHVAEIDPRSRPKICAHRNNNILMYRRAQANFSCVEIDVHVSPASGGPPGVYHPPDANYHGLTLEFLLTHEKLPTGKLWLDTKDLSPENWRGYLELLDRLIPAARHPDIIVETVWGSPDVQPVAAAFRQGGFQFSYYLPTDAAAECGSRVSPACDEFRRDVLGTLARGFSHLSFDAGGYAFVRSIKDDLPASVKLLTWDLSPTWPDAELLEDVDVYIVAVPNPYLN
jgi:hypothetical protein